MTWLADAALWAVIALTGTVAGVLASWIRKDGRAPIVDPLVLCAAAAAVASLCARAGQVLGGPTTSLWVTAWLPVDASPLSRVATLWATLPGGTLVSATVLLVWLAMSSQSRVSSAGTRHSMIVVVAALCLSAASAWFQPGISPAASVPPFAQHPAASLAALSALVSITILGWALSAGFARREASNTQLYLAWSLATAAVALEQIARSATGIGPRDAISLGSASSGLILWLVASGLLHNGIQGRLFGTVKASRSRIATLAAHVGAACVVFSFALHAVASRANVLLPPGQPVSVPDAFGKEWKLVNQGVSQFDEDAAEVTALTVEVNSPRGTTTLLTPEIREFHAPDGQHIAGGVLRRRSTPGAIQTVRILFTGADSLDAGSVRVTFLPAPILWNAGILLLVVAALAGLSSRQTVTHRNS